MGGVMIFLAVVVGLAVGAVPQGATMAEGVRTGGGGITQRTSVGLPPPPSPSAPVAPGLALLLEPDKLLHMSISANLALGSTALAQTLGVPRRWALLIGAGTALGLGVLKELWDLRGGGHAEWADLGADLLGTTAGISVSLLFGSW